MFSVCGNPVTSDPHAQLLAWEGAGWLFSLLQGRIGSLQSTKLHFILRKEFELILGLFFLMVCACRCLSRDQVSYSLPASFRELNQRKCVVCAWDILNSKCCITVLYATAFGKVGGFFGYKSGWLEYPKYAFSLHFTVQGLEKLEASYSLEVVTGALS